MRLSMLAMLVSAALVGADIQIDNTAVIRVDGHLVTIANRRDNSEMVVGLDRIVSVSLGNVSDNNSYTVIALPGGNSIRLQQRNHPAHDVKTTLMQGGFTCIDVVGDRERDIANPDSIDEVLVNPAYLSYLDRTKTNTDRSDTIVAVNTGSGSVQYTINQSQTAYARLRERLVAVNSGR